MTQTIFYTLGVCAIMAFYTWVVAAVSSRIARQKQRDIQSEYEDREDTHTSIARIEEHLNIGDFKEPEIGPGLDKIATQIEMLTTLIEEHRLKR